MSSDEDWNHAGAAELLALVAIIHAQGPPPPELRPGLEWVEKAALKRAAYLLTGNPDAELFHFVERVKDVITPETSAALSMPAFPKTGLA